MIRKGHGYRYMLRIPKFRVELVRILASENNATFYFAYAVVYVDRIHRWLCFLWDRIIGFDLHAFGPCAGWSDEFVLWSTHTKLIGPSENPQLYSIVQKVANEAHIPMPKVGIVDSAQPNAFATGKGPKKAIVVCTTSILRMLSPSELEAVIGHEISHVTHRDVLVSSIAATLAGAISYIGQIVIFSSFFGGFGNSRGRGQQNSSYAILAIIAAILIPIAAMLIQLGLSRSRETSADEAGARLTQK